MRLKLSSSLEELAFFCKKHGIKKMAVFGSMLRGDYRPDSDVDVLVEFDPANITNV